MYSQACKGMEVGGQDTGDCLPFARLHLGDGTTANDNPSVQLHIENVFTQRTANRVDDSCRS